jgi:hypothetical protein
MLYKIQFLTSTILYMFWHWGDVLRESCRTKEYKSRGIMIAV